VSVRDAVALLRDRRGTQRQALELGDRRAIDALIAAHGVVMNTSQRVLWVSEEPHLLGRFLAFDLRRLLAADPQPVPGAVPTTDEVIAPDPFLTSGEYARWRERHGPNSWH